MIRRCVLVVAISIAAGACGPIAYVNQVTRRAQSSVETAKAAEAEKYSPYYWTRATQYLHQARELAAHADFQGANRFGELAAEAGDKATEDAAAVKLDPSKGPIILSAPAQGDERVPAKDVAPAPAKSVAPAKDAD